MKCSVLVACVAIALSAVGCGGNDKSGGSSADKAPGKSKESTSGGAQAPVVTMRGIAFKPTELDVKRGTTVTWTNEDSVGHDVHGTDGPGPKFASGSSGGLAKGDTFKHTFTKAGTFDYVCSVHSGMSGFVIVR